MFYLPHKRLRTPELLIPGRKPVGLVRPSLIGLNGTSFYLLQNNGSLAQDVVSARHGVITGATRQQDYLHFDNPTENVALPDMCNAVTAATVIMRVRTDSSNTSTLAAAYCGGISPNRLYLGQRFANYILRVGSEGFQTIAGVVVGEWVTIAMTVDTTTTRGFLDRGRVMTTGDVSGTVGDSTEYLGTYDASQYGWLGDISWALIDPNRAWSADEVFGFMDDPFKDLHPPGPEYLAFSTGGAPPVGITSPILSSYGIHSSVFGGQVITG